MRDLPDPARLIFLVLVSLPVFAGGQGQAAPNAANRTQPHLDEAKARVLAEEIEQTMWQELDQWYPRAVDVERGGFMAAFDGQWNAKSEQTRFLVFQARMTWTAAAVAEHVAESRPDVAGQYREYARHGIAYLDQFMWDDEHGGFFWELTEDGQFTPDVPQEKHAYGIAFGIYAAATAHRVLEDERSLDLAIRSFRWLDRHAYDARHGGYHEALTLEGDPIRVAPTDDPDQQHDLLTTAYGFKSMNTHIHLLEAYTALYEVWPDPELRERLEELVRLIGHTMHVPPGCLNQFFTEAWAAVPDSTSFGHNIETAFLLDEAAQVLGEDVAKKTRPISRELVDHTLEWGYDTEYGGIYDDGAAFRPAHGLKKTWWAQAEALNGFLLMHKRHGDETPRYGQAFVHTWRFMLNHQFDSEHHGWHWQVGRDGELAGPAPDKGSDWKAAYHTTRALIYCLQLLDELPRSN